MRLRTLAVLSALSFSLITAGCGGGGEGAGSEAADTESTPAAAAEPAGSAVIEGTINFAGTPPERTPLRVDRECLEGIEGPILSEEVVVNDNNTLKWAFVYVKEGLEGQTFAPPSQPVELDQEHCMYVPHVLGIQTGQTLKILNSDSFQHNIHAMPNKNRPFNFSTPMKGMEREADFRTPEIMVHIKCDVHGWMSAYAGVLPHPYFDTTGDDGTFRIEGLPAGTYVVEAWHETYGTQTMNVTVGDGETQTTDFTFGGASS